jgi:hypothetical protein
VSKWEISEEILGAHSASFAECDRALFHHRRQLR